MLTNPHLYEFLLALALPHVFWVLLAILAARNPRLLPRLYPFLRALAWTLLGSALAWMSGALFFHTKNFYAINAILIALSGGTNLVYSWVRRRVSPGPMVKEPDHGWWPTPKEPYVDPGKTL